jgi:hypothetical protein
MGGLRCSVNVLVSLSAGVKRFWSPTPNAGCRQVDRYSAQAALRRGILLARVGGAQEEDDLGEQLAGWWRAAALAPRDACDGLLGRGSGRVGCRLSITDRAAVLWTRFMAYTAQCCRPRPVSWIALGTSVGDRASATLALAQSSAHNPAEQDFGDLFRLLSPKRRALASISGHDADAPPFDQIRRAPTFSGFDYADALGLCHAARTERIVRAIRLA